MNRRSFLCGLAALLPAAWAAKLLPAEPVARFQRDDLVYRFAATQIDADGNEQDPAPFPDGPPVGLPVSYIIVPPSMEGLARTVTKRG